MVECNHVRCHACECAGCATLKAEVERLREVERLADAFLDATFSNGGVVNCSVPGCRVCVAREALHEAIAAVGMGKR